MNNNKTIAKNTLYLYFRMMVIIAINGTIKYFV